MGSDDFEPDLEPGAWIRQERERRNWSGTEFAERLGIRQTRVSNYERGQYEIPESMIRPIADIFDLPVIDVRKHLGLWVPSEIDLAELRYQTDPRILTDDVLIEELMRRFQRGSTREIRDIFQQRSNVPNSLWVRMVESASELITLGGYTNYFFWTEQPNFHDILRKKSEQGVKIRFLIGDPDSEVTRERERVENVPFTLTTRIQMTLTELDRLSELPNIEVRMSDRNAEAHVCRSVFQFDKEMLVTEHIAQNLGNGSLTYHIRQMSEEGPYSRYFEHNEFLWEGAQPYSLQQKSKVKA